jgi:hypothetical protein
MGAVLPVCASRFHRVEAQTLDITIKWQFAQPMIFKHERSMIVRISKRSMMLLTDDDFDDDD